MKKNVINSAEKDEPGKKGAYKGKCNGADSGKDHAVIATFPEMIEKCKKQERFSS